MQLRTSNQLDKLMNKALSDSTRYKRRARLGAILWTLLIFFLCFIPAGDVPEVKLPLIDKWVHFILFGVFAFLWLLSTRNFRLIHLIIVLVCAIALGWLVEVLQGQLTFLGRSRDNMDALADSVGGLLGVIIFYLFHTLTTKRNKQTI